MRSPYCQRQGNDGDGERCRDEKLGQHALLSSPIIDDRFDGGAKCGKRCRDGPCSLPLGSSGFFLKSGQALTHPRDSVAVIAIVMVPFHVNQPCGTTREASTTEALDAAR
jgi:hypothetical protein